MQHIVLIATAWGPRYGGINAFNYDLACALGILLKNAYLDFQAVCLVAEAGPADEQDAAKHGVQLVSLELPPSQKPLGDEHTERAVAHLNMRLPGFTPAHIVGHDATSGALALSLAKAIGGVPSLIHHMDYRAYEGFKHSRGQVADDKHVLQQKLFQAATHRLAVGPMLRNSLAELIDEDPAQVPMLIPGFLDYLPRKHAPSRFSAIIFGRLEFRDDRVKQGRLAVAALGRAIRVDREQAPQNRRLQGATLYTIGALGSGVEKAKEEASIQKLAADHAGGVVNVVPLPFTENRNELWERLAKASVAMMPSWHEGFGLTGWEAIGLCVPLIISRQSGVYQLIENVLGRPGLACIHPVDVLGQVSNDDGDESFSDQDLKEVAAALRDLANDSERSRKEAKLLRDLLQAELNATWHHTAEQFMDTVEPSWRAKVRLTVPADGLAARSDPAQIATRQAQASAKANWLELRAPRWQPGGSPSRLLSSEEQVVPFHASRIPLVDRICSWARDGRSGPVAVQLHVGPGGCGKTRLLIEVCQRLNSEHGWQAGFLRRGEPISVSLDKALTQGLHQQPHTLVVLDYGELRAKEIAALVHAGQNMPASHRLRIVLLARTASDWWKNLTTTESSFATLYDSPFPDTLSGPYFVPDLQLQEQDRQIAYQEALSAFAARLSRQRPSDNPPLDEDSFAAPLAIHLLALLTVLGDTPDSSVDSLLDALLQHERKYWQSMLQAGTSLDAVQQMVALLTLLHGVREADMLRKVIKRAPLLREAPHTERESLRKQLSSLYPLEGGADGLRPDLLGEFLVDRALLSDDGILDALCMPPASAAWQHAALSVLTRIARRWPQKARWLQRALDRHLPELAVVATRVAIQSGAPLGGMLTEVLRRANAPIQREVAKKLSAPGILPEKTEVLSDLACLVAELSLAELQNGPSLRPDQQDQLAKAKSLLAFRLSEADRVGEALAISLEALPLWQQLLASDPAKHREGWLRHMMNTSAHHLTAGIPQEGAALARRTIEQVGQQDLSRTEQILVAGTLSNLAAHLTRLGQYREALPFAREAFQKNRGALSDRPNSTSERAGLGAMPVS